MAHVFITGASSGIGLALAREFSSRGHRVSLAARRIDLLREEALRLPDAEAFACDVTEMSSVAEAVRGAQRRAAVDIAIANAGITRPLHLTSFDAIDAAAVLQTNINGVMHLFAAVAPEMIARRSGRFVAIASLAGIRALPGSAVYSASKSAVQAFVQAARPELAEHGVRVTIVNPGFVATPLTATNRFRMPGLMSAERAAKRIADGIERGEAKIEFPKRLALLMKALRMMPDALADRVLWRRR